MESVVTHISQGLLTLVLAVLGWFLRQAIKKLEQQEHTRVKANLCFDDLVDRKPEIQRHYDAVMSRNGN